MILDSNAGVVLSTSLRDKEKDGFIRIIVDKIIKYYSYVFVEITEKYIYL